MHYVQNSYCSWVRSPVVCWSRAMLLSSCLFWVVSLKKMFRSLILYSFKKCWYMLKAPRELWDCYLRSVTGMQRAQTQAETLLSWRWLVSDWLHMLAKEITSVCTSPLEITRGCVNFSTLNVPRPLWHVRQLAQKSSVRTFQIFFTLKRTVTSWTAFWKWSFAGGNFQSRPSWCCVAQVQKNVA